MPSTRKLRILLVDNEPERLEGLRTLLAADADVMIRDPFDVEVSDLELVDLVSVDEFLGDEWMAATAQGTLSSPASIRNRDGLAVAASFRSQSRSVLTGEGSDFAVTLHTGELARLAEGLPAARRESMTAAQHDLEWVFEWGAEGFERRIVALANAVNSASERGSTIGSDFGARWLRVPERSWAITARAQIEDCRPPAHALAHNTDGRSVVRWLAHRVLPYPTFLLDHHHAANLLGMTADSFDNFARTEHFKGYDAEYCGPLHDFQGKRWWRAALQQMLVDQDVFQWDSASDRTDALAAHAGIPLTSLFNEQPVVAYNADGYVQTIDAEPEGSVRLQADGWPVYADDAWALISEASDEPALSALVAQAERQKLSGSR